MDDADRRVEELSRRLKPFSPEHSLGDAAVALILRKRNKDLEALFVKRVISESDPWSGQIALPGGKFEVADGDLRGTVLRETMEEVGVDILRCCRILGIMRVSRTVVRPAMKILPFVVFEENRSLIRLNTRELQTHHWVSLQKLSESRSSAAFSFGKFPAYVIGEVVIWGMTYRILERLFRLMQ